MKNALKIGTGILGGGAAAWTPATPIGGLLPSLWEIAGTGAYQEATPVTPAVSDGDAIGYETDQSANANHLTRAINDTYRPTLKLNILSGNPVARYTPSNRMTFSKTVISATGYVWFVVAKLTDNAGAYTIMAENDGTRRAALYATTTNFEVRYFTGAAYVSGGQQKAADTNAHVLTMQHTGSAVDLYVDGVKGTGTGTLVPDSTAQKSLGYSSIGFLKGDIAEVICYVGEMNATNRAAVEAYLTAKFF